MKEKERERERERGREGASDGTRHFETFRSDYAGELIPWGCREIRSGEMKKEPVVTTQHPKGGGRFSQRLLLT